MAKKDPGLNFASEEQFAQQMSKTMKPSAFKQVIDQLRTGNLSAKNITADSLSVKTAAEPVTENSKEVQSKKDQLKSTEELTQSNKKLVTNIEKLTTSLSSSILGKANRAEEIAGKQKLDYRGIGQQFKEKIMGRGGDKWDPNSLRYKLGSLRGLARTTGLVKEGGFIDNKLAVREERLRTATRMTEANAGMENLGPKGNKTFGSKAAVEKYYQERGKDTIKARAALQSEEYNREKYREAGISDEEYERTAGGKRQIKALAEAGQAVIDVDPRMQGEKKGAVKFAGPEESVDDKLNVSQEEESQLKAIESASEPINELIRITKEENERKAKADTELLEAVKGIESSGGGTLNSVANAASNLIGGKGKGKAAGKLGKFGKLGSFAAKNATKLKIGGGLLAGGLAAYEGYSDYKDADEQVKSGAITQDEGDIKKTSAVTGAAGGLGGTLAGGAIGQALIPIPGVGFVVGASVGALAGSKIGKGIGEWGAKTWKGITGGSNKESGFEASSKETHNMHVEGMGTNNPKYIIDGQEVDPDTYTRIANMDTGTAQIEAMKKASADAVAAKSSDNAMAKLPDNKPSSNTIVNAPTTVSKQTQNNNMKVPVRDQDHSVKSYYRSRFAT